MKNIKTNSFLLEAPNISRNCLHFQWWHGKESSVGANPGSGCQREARGGVSVEEASWPLQVRVRVCGREETPCPTPEWPKLLSP